MKQVDIQSDDELEDYTIEIDILTGCDHKNIVQLYEAFLHDDKLWVCTKLLALFSGNRHPYGVYPLLFS